MLFHVVLLVVFRVMRFELFYLCVNLYSDTHGVVWFAVVWHMYALCCLFVEVFAI